MGTIPMPSSSKTEALDQGDQALQEGAALVDCLKEACEGQGQFRMPHVATVLTVVAACIHRAHNALEALSGP